MSANDFDGLITVVSGGASGIGSATALELICHLAGPLAGPTTGTAMDVDGGATHLRVRPLPA